MTSLFQPCRHPGVFLAYSHSPVLDDCMVSLHCDEADCNTNGIDGLQFTWALMALTNAARIKLP